MIIISDIIGSNISGGTALDQIIFLALLSVGSALTGGFPMFSSAYFEFSMSRVFILSLFFLWPYNPTVYFAVASILAGAAFRRNMSSSKFWRYLTSGILMVLILESGPYIYRSLGAGIPNQTMIVSTIPILIVIEIVISMLFSIKGTNYIKLSRRVLIGYLAAIPLSLLTVILVLQDGILGTTLAFAGLTGFSFMARSISHRNQRNTRRIMEISHQDRLATRLMNSSSYEEFILELQKSIFKDSDSRIRVLTKSTGSFDWILWDSEKQSGLDDKDIKGTIPDKGRFTGNLIVKNVSGTALGLLENQNLIIVLSGREKDVLQKMPSYLLDNMVLLLGRTWEAVGHFMRSERSFLAAAVMLARLADSKDDYTHGHSLRVAALSCSLGRYLHLSPENIQTLRVASILHDIGKLAIPASILLKRGLLTKKEREIVEAHPVEGARIVSGLSGYEEVARIIRGHHERLDGNGYPDGLRNEDISFMTRIVAVADTFDAITSDRSYHSISRWESALEAIKEETGSKFDSRVVSALESTLSNKKTGMA